MSTQTETRMSDREYNALTTQLDEAIRLLHHASKYGRRGLTSSADPARLAAAEILENIGPDKLIIDPELT